MNGQQLVQSGHRRRQEPTRRDHEMKVKRRRKKTRASLMAKARQWQRRRS